jgi:phosphoribosylformimino-5-aminoimidazole carboxamide ribotide isomerase
MNIIPVIDILNGEVVRGVAGRRSEYRPIVSKLTESIDAVSVARAIRDAFGLYEFYVADLDGILSQTPNHSIYEQLSELGFGLMIDCGVTSTQQVVDLKRNNRIRPIVSLECCRSPEELSNCVRESPDTIFSLDLISGVPRKSRNSLDWTDRPIDVVRQAVEANARSLIVLDLADVGMSTGGSTDELCRHVKNAFPTIELIAGGGVRDATDLARFSRLGVDGLLVASALHDGRLTRHEIERALRD